MSRMVHQGIRGSMTAVPKRYAEANNKYMGDKYDASQPSKYISLFVSNDQAIANTWIQVDDRSRVEQLEKYPMHARSRLGLTRTAS